jgi:hypothetical protein
VGYGWRAVTTPLDVERRIRARYGPGPDSTGRRGKPNPERRARTAVRRSEQAEELSMLIERMGVRPAHVARLISCDKSTLVNYLRGRRSTPQWVLDAVRALAADPARVRLSTVMSEADWQALRSAVTADADQPVVDLCVHEYPGEPDRLCDDVADGPDMLCAGHRAERLSQAS